MKRIKVISDYTALDAPNFLVIIRDDQGDIHINLYEYAGKEPSSSRERGVRIAADGTRHSPEVRQAFYDLITAYEKELADPHTRRDLKMFNDIDTEEGKAKL